MVLQVLSGLGYATHRIKCESYRVSVVKVVCVLTVLQMCAMVGDFGGIYVSVGSFDGASLKNKPAVRLNAASKFNGGKPVEAKKSIASFFGGPKK